nr:RecName: Full=Superoxide dismutase [Fe-Zn] [Streptomyces griseus]
ATYTLPEPPYDYAAL